MTSGEVRATGRREIGINVETDFHDCDIVGLVCARRTRDSADTAKIYNAGVSVALFFLQHATNLVVSSGENSRSRSSGRHLDSLTGFPVHADRADVQEAGANKVSALE